MKKCFKCNTEKDTSLFYKNRSECKECSKRYTEANKEKIRLRHQKWYQDNIDTLTKKGKEYRENNPEVGKEYYLKNKDKKSLYNKEYHSKNQDKIKKQQYDWYHKNKHSIAEKRRNDPAQMERKRVYERYKYHNDPVYKLSRSLRSHFRHSIKNGCKMTSIMNIIGCSVEELRAYIESLWINDMSWENHGSSKLGEEKKWHIDHIIPISFFDMTDIEQQKKCWHYTNLRPLWQNENVSKSDKLPDGQSVRCLKRRQS